MSNILGEPTWARILALIPREGRRLILNQFHHRSTDSCVISEEFHGLILDSIGRFMRGGKTPTDSFCYEYCVLSNFTMASAPVML